MKTECSRQYPAVCEWGWKHCLISEFHPHSWIMFQVDSGCRMEITLPQHLESFLWALVFHYLLKNIADVFKICSAYNVPLFSLLFLGAHYIFTDPIQHLLCFFKLKIHQSLIMEIRPHSLWREPVPFLCLLILENACFMSVWQSHHLTCLWRLLSLFSWPSVVLKPRCSSWWSFPSGMPWPFWHTGLCIFIRIHFPKCIWCCIEYGIARGWSGESSGLPRSPCYRQQTCLIFTTLVA